MIAFTRLFTHFANHKDHVSVHFESMLLQYLKSTPANGLMTLKQMLPILAKSLQDSRIQLDTERSYWKEVQWRDKLIIDPLKEDASVENQQLDTGDIIIIQEQLTQVRFSLKELYSTFWSSGSQDTKNLKCD